MSENKIAALSSYSSNNNLLDNWYFVNSINQRGIASTYDWPRWQTGIDRWKRNGETGMSYWRNNRIEHEGDSSIYQILTVPADTFKGMTLTLSALDSNGRLSTITGTVPAMNSTWQIAFGNADVQLELDVTNIYLAYVYMNNCIAAKLEINDHQTLAHKIDEHWELNEIPNYQLELIKCQRYFRHIEAVSVSWGSTWYFIPLNYPAMYNYPAVQVDGPIYDKSGTLLTGWTHDSANVSRDGIVWIKFNNLTSEIGSIRNIFLDTGY